MDYNPGDIVRVYTDPGFTNAAGALADPTTITMRWRVAGGVETSWVYGTNAEVVKDSTGVYHADIPITTVGLHYYQWEGTGAVATVEGETFMVTSNFP